MKTDPDEALYNARLNERLWSMELPSAAPSDLDSIRQSVAFWQRRVAELEAAAR